MIGKGALRPYSGGPYTKILADPGYHYFERDQRFNDCVIHTLNLWAEGDVFGARENFMKLYSRIRRKNKETVLRDKRLKGIDILSLKRVIYDPKKDWFYSTQLSNIISFADV